MTFAVWIGNDLNEQIPQIEISENLSGVVVIASTKSHQWRFQDFFRDFPWYSHDIPIIFPRFFQDFSHDFPWEPLGKSWQVLPGVAGQAGKGWQDTGYMCLFIHLYTYTHTHTYIYIYVCIYIYICVDIDIDIDTEICIHEYVYIYIYNYTSFQGVFLQSLRKWLCRLLLIAAGLKMRLVW